MNYPYLNTPRALARFLTGMGYDRGEAIAAVAKDFPQADAEAAVDDAIAAVGARDMALDQEVETDAAAARAAEHDTSRTMHRKEQ